MEVKKPNEFKYHMKIFKGNARDICKGGDSVKIFSLPCQRGSALTGKNLLNREQVKPFLEGAWCT